MSKNWTSLSFFLIVTLSLEVFAQNANESFIKDIQSQCTDKVCNLKIDGPALADLITSSIKSQMDKVDMTINEKRYLGLLSSLRSTCPLTEVKYQSGVEFWWNLHGTCDFDVKTVSESPLTYVPVFSWADTSSPASKLWTWLLHQKDNSVTPYEFFLAGLNFSNGNVMDALMASSDVLKIGNKAGIRRNYYIQTKKLIDIRGDRALLSKVNPPGNDPRVWTPDSDNFSAWYHFFGAMAYSFYLDINHPFLTQFVSGGTITEEVATSDEEICVHSEVYLRCGKRIEIDREGAKAGDELARSLKRIKEGIPTNLVQTPYIKISAEEEKDPLPRYRSGRY